MLPSQEVIFAIADESFSWVSGNAYLLGENINFDLGGGGGFYEYSGTFTASPAILQTMSSNDIDLSPGQMTLYCTEDPALCDEVLESIGVSSIKSLPCQNCNKPTKEVKRIYTIDEANQVAGKVNSFKIRYR